MKIHDNMITAFKDVRILLDNFSNDKKFNSIIKIKEVIDVAKRFDIND